MLSLRETAESTSSFTGPAVSWQHEEHRDKVPVLRIRTFDSAEAGALAALPTYAETLRNAPAFVVDLRGNGGGNYGFAERFVAALTDRALQRLDEREVVSIAAADGRANGARARLARGEVPESAIGVFREHLERLEHIAKDLSDHGGPTRADRVTKGAIVHGTASGPLRGRGVFLVDGGCASACEMMIALARQIPGVVVAGQSTRGSMAVGELALFRLPSSGLNITLGTRAFHDPRFDFAETRGYLPDLWIDGDDALDDAVQVAAGPMRQEALARR
jgi:C-terminal processing protease CtpA/Prc